MLKPIQSLMPNMGKVKANGGGKKPDKAIKGKSGRRPVEVSFPRDPLKKALKLAESIEKNNAGKAYNRLDLAQSVELSPSSYSYRSLLRSSLRYGLTEGSEKSDRISLTQLGVSIVSPTQEDEINKGLREALLRSPIFKRVFEFFDKKRIPTEELFKNALKREFGLPPEDVEACYDVLKQNMRDYGLIQKIKENDYLQLDKLSPATIGVIQGLEEKSELEAVGGEEEIEETEEVSDLEKKATAPLAQERSKEIFVAHGKNKKPLEQLRAILTQFKVPFRVAIDEPHKGRAISSKVAGLMHQCGSGIFIFTADEETLDVQGDKVLRPSDNVVFELGAGTVIYGDKIVILREEGVSFGSDFTDYGHITFEKDRLDAKALDLIKELIGLGFLQVTPT